LRFRFDPGAALFGSFLFAVRFVAEAERPGRRRRREPFDPDGAASVWAPDAAPVFEASAFDVAAFAGRRRRRRRFAPPVGASAPTAGASDAPCSSAIGRS
jgi:hypothetical protein